MRPLPADLAAQVRPMPPGFAPVLTEVKPQKGPAYVRWADTLRAEGRTPFRAELGYPKPNDPTANTALRAEIWQVMEYFRLGRIDLLAHVAADRHDASRRPVSAPEPQKEAPTG